MTSLFTLDMKRILDTEAQVSHKEFLRRCPGPGLSSCVYRTVCVYISRQSKEVNSWNRIRVGTESSHDRHAGRQRRSDFVHQDLLKNGQEAESGTSEKPLRF